ncbi:uncharacterized protein PV06_10515 [Exophiala oligosperma]|uniref:Xylanolytic transcriptional activator regulatory domain-containing protein n=1 Tax=Exophiala oligosperma TaxID=215243 RepID=A0A0D2AAV7_9EURO|nr:uncharacterized protein PV06_10515 [Exophiala oligosperma]KIW37476.1 hypothetical protein PV06_10515 [Exophiala oligosperma]
MSQSSGPDRRYWAQIADRASNFDIINVPSSPEDGSECDIDFDDELESLWLPALRASGGTGPPVVEETRIIRASDSHGKGRSSEATIVEYTIDSNTLSFSSLHGRLHHPPNRGTHWYGPTSHLHYSRNALLESLCQPSRGVPAESNRAHQAAIITSEINTDDEKSLEDLFFSWQNPALHGIGREEYFEAKNKMRVEQNVELCSTALVNAILAVSALSASRTSFRTPRGYRPADFFAQRARRLLENDIDNPTLATAHAILVLCMYEMAEGNDSRVGWLYTGMAVQLLYELGLHIPLANSANLGNLPSTKTQNSIHASRQRTYWAICNSHM